MTVAGGDAFAPAARRLAGLAGAALGWAPDTFWAATPADLATAVAARTGGEGPAVCADAATTRRLQEAFPDG